RTLFIHGARAVALVAKEPGPWITAHGRKYDRNHVSIRPY
ncbi:TPA: IS110 family transposase, partial [Escherichia coli]